MSDAALHHEFQYPSAKHQAETAISGMWLFLATEVLFFGALFLGWIYARHGNVAGFDAGAKHTQLAIGTINTVILVTSSLSYSAGLVFIAAGNTRRLMQCLAATWLLGLAFLLLKFGLEWQTVSPPPTENFAETPVVTNPPYNYPWPQAVTHHV